MGWREAGHLRVTMIQVAWMMATGHMIPITGSPRPPKLSRRCAGGANLHATLTPGRTVRVEDRVLARPSGLRLRRPQRGTSAAAAGEPDLDAHARAGGSCRCTGAGWGPGASVQSRFRKALTAKGRCWANRWPQVIHRSFSGKGFVSEVRMFFMLGMPCDEPGLPRIWAGRLEPMPGTRSRICSGNRGVRDSGCIPRWRRPSRRGQRREPRNAGCSHFMSADAGNLTSTCRSHPQGIPW
jgi:hypothetical protein